MKVALCTCFIPPEGMKHHEDYCSITDEIKKLYCRRHPDVEFLYSRETPHEGRDPHFCKFGMLIYALSQGYDWAIWMDADAAPVNMDADVAKFLSSLDQTKMVMQKDINGWNSGVFAVPNTETAMRWLAMLDGQEAHDFFKDAPTWDQEAIIQSLELPEFKDFVQEPPPRFGWNDYEPIYKYYGNKFVPNEYNRNSWCLHIPGYADVYRRNRFASILADLKGEHCPICGCISKEYFTVPFDKTADKVDAEFKRQDGDVAYHVCPNCSLVFAPEFQNWSDEQFKERIYNEDYTKIDRDFGDARAKRSFDSLGPLLAGRNERHLDYGCGNGLLSKMLEERGLSSDGYDPYYHDRRPPDWFKYSVVTCLEVLEHIPFPTVAFADFRKWLIQSGMLIVTTPLYDFGNPATFGVEPSKWPMAAPRNGHVCIYSVKTLRHLAAMNGFMFREDQSDYKTQVFQKI